jgi:hypothetical protein
MLKVQLVVPAVSRAHGLGLDIIVPVIEFANDALNVDVPLPLIVAVNLIGVVPIILSELLPVKLVIVITGGSGTTVTSGSPIDIFCDSPAGLF